MARSLPTLMQHVDVFHGVSFPWVSLINAIDGLKASPVTAPEQVTGSTKAILILDAGMLTRFSFEEWRGDRTEHFLTICEDPCDLGDFLVPEGWPKSYTAKALEGAVNEWFLAQSREKLQGELLTEHEKIAQLTSIAQDLSAETNLDKLLTKILSEGRALACCDAASLFLIDKDAQGGAELVFKLTQNDSISFPFEEIRFPLNTNSISGFVAVTGEICNIPDVYRLDESLPYEFNRSFDQTMGYRTCSMVTIPMCNHQTEKGVIGVLQFLNRKSSPDIKLTNTDVTLKHTLPFSPDLTELLMALASQAAIAIENANLIYQIENLFEGFVKASVTAIEQRDPTTSGHSFRVANLTTHLALATTRSGMSRFNQVRFSDEAIREIRYASLLHDFGKVGVREHVLVKADKLPHNGLELIRLRFAVFMEQLQRRRTEERLTYVLAHGRDAYHKAAKAFDQRLEEELERYKRYYDAIAEANKPSILPEGTFHHLEEIRDHNSFDTVLGEDFQLLRSDEFAALSVKKGSLTHDERKEIESHVRHTFEFLSRIPWTPDLRRVPEIAYGHHEKLDGSGYPRGLHETDIPLPSKMMTVADIYDALTASDRPYKPAVPLDRALAILEAEADRGLLDGDLVKIFCEARVFDQSENDLGHSEQYYNGFTDRFIKRNTCDYDLDEITDPS